MKQNNASASSNPVWLFYVRSSTVGNESMDAQVRSLMEHYEVTPEIIIRDTSDGFSENRRNIFNLMALVNAEKITDIALTNPDRLSKIGYGYLVTALESRGITVHIMSDEPLDHPNKDDVENLTNIVNKFFYDSEIRDPEIRSQIVNEVLQNISS